MSNESAPKISSFDVGLQLDSHPFAKKDGEYSYCLNGAITHKEEGDPFIGCLEGFKMKYSLPEGYMLIGSRNMGTYGTVVMYVNSVGDSEIGWVKKGIYKKVVNDSNLKFSIFHQITIRHKINYLGEVIIYWTDDNEPPRWMNLNKPKFLQVPDINNC